jgi:hypothetical protein
MKTVAVQGMLNITACMHFKFLENVYLNIVLYPEQVKKLAMTYNAFPSLVIFYIFTGFVFNYN